MHESTDNPTPPIRSRRQSACYVNATTTLVALLAMAASGPLLGPTTAPVDGRAVMSESQAVRIVAAAVVAAARDLMGADISDAAMTAPDYDDTSTANSADDLHFVLDERRSTPALLAECLLDLPPPAAC